MIDSSMVAATVRRATEAADRAERRFVLHQVPWSAYVMFRDALDDAGNRGVRMTYLEGTLELMSPSALHEESKKILARLIEVWAEEKNVDLRGFGSTTFRKEAKQRGLEPDECYTLGRRKDEDSAPDIAIEVVVRAPLVDKLAVYAGLTVQEVWLWDDARKAIEVHRLMGEGYEIRPRSEIVPELDLALLSRFVRPGESHTALARAFRTAIASK
jgi:Uma2 family endonuclease